MELHRTDEERLESLKSWWNQHGRTLIAGVVIGLAGVSGWTFWQDYERGRSETASALFQTVGEAAASGDHATVREAASTLLADHGGGGYAVAASLLLARSALLEGGVEEAKVHLERVLEQAELPELREVARLRLAETYFETGAFDESLDLLDATPTGPFAAASDELRGDIHFARNEPEKAREAWERAASGYSDSARSVERVTLKMNDLGHLNTP